MGEVRNEGFEHATRKYAESLEDFVGNHELPWRWFATLDHLAVKCMDAEHYEDTVQGWLSGANIASYVWLNNRRLASLNLENGLTIGRFGKVEWLEVMEPRPERAGKDVVGLEHVEFVFPDFAAVQALLDRRRIPYEQQSNLNHNWLNLVINEYGQELKLTDKPLAQMVTEGLESGEAYVL